MSKETETTELTYNTPRGKLKIISTFVIRREPYTGLHQVCNRKLESTKIEADGGWLTAEMAEELAAWLSERKGTQPAWLDQA